jgi:hypothetical protein
MKNLWARAGLLAFLISLPGLKAAEKQYQTGQIVSVEKKSRERVLYYLVNTPVTQDDPYYEVQLQQNAWLYRAEYTPRHSGDSLPDDWEPGAEVQMKISDKHHVWVKKSTGPELQLVVLKRVPATGEVDAPQPAPTQE